MLSLCKANQWENRVLTEVGRRAGELCGLRSREGQLCARKPQSFLPALPLTSQEPEGTSSLLQVFDFSSCQKWTTLQWYHQPYKSEGIKDLDGSVNVRWENKSHWHIYAIRTSPDLMTTALGLSAQVSHTPQGQASSGTPNSNHLGFLSSIFITESAYRKSKVLSNSCLLIYVCMRQGPNNKGPKRDGSWWIW